MLFNRMKKRIIFAFLLLLCSLSLVSAQTQVIAHRGFWKHEGAAQNSRASLQYALDLNIYGSETDIWLTADGHLMVNHDSTYGGVRIEKASYADCKNLILKNGEKMPELKDFLKVLAESASSVKLIIEIKSHATPERNREAARRTVEEVRKYGMENKVEYISFNLEACKALVQEAPKAKVAYLGSEHTPARLFSEGCTGVDFSLGTFRKHPHWMAEAHRLGMTVNVWTVDKVEDMQKMKADGADFITTNEPLQCSGICTSSEMKGERQ